MKAVIFDLYGTVVTKPNHLDPHRRLFDELGLKGEERKEAMNLALTEEFDTIQELVDRLRPGANYDAAGIEKEIMAVRKNVAVFPEAKSVLVKARGMGLRIGLLSNASTPYKEPFLDKGLREYFDRIMFSCDIGCRKPERKAYYKILGRLNVRAWDALMVGDSIKSDVIGPRAVGMETVHIDRSKGDTLEKIFDYL